ncbi:pyridoxal-dependent decarboxylase, exosortase A system-associated [Pseudoduganella sp. FT25W]|uniref:Pyridoxal-dependent decarboxylase, exosortase A system-associated n=1 Tax=Duganella alba TaxID=2666081 RepID=A0A6L5Q9S1_9BURK|nr:pyridoxal-dependent decarboxylase, exosortase A system-associated [Duganella alba]MRX06435.1 pyridoxal-dependent decarboxylase, exosortase A system-associated [Duganella alba]MRX14829.1 pyridoxal-dependent decarboxylase, exosortase A system-associated [Duganella alba]
MTPSHAELRQFPVLDDCLQLGGITLTRLAERVGRTPFYAYERQHIQSRIALLRELLPPGLHLHYAIKANPMPALVQMMAPMVDGFDVASGGELKTALDTGMPPARISFAGPGKSNAELRSAVAAGVVLHLESEDEMERAARVGELLGIAPRVAVRVNPEFELKYAGMKMAGGARQFGVDAERVPAMLRKLGRLELDFFGFHLFCGAQNLSAKAIGEAQRLCVELGLRLAHHAPAPLRLLNIGGGFGVPYFPGERALDLRAVADGLRATMQTLCAAAPETQLVLELGRYLVAEGGIYVCRVLERKLSHGQVFVITDGGLHHHLAASGNFGQVIRKNYPVAIGNRMQAGPREVATVVGPLCTPLDLLADSMELARAEPGDYVVVFQSGAYGLTASPTAFLGHPPPLEVLV